MLRGHLLKEFHESAAPLVCLCLCQVSHVLNVAYGVTNKFPDQLTYKTLQILDLPDTDIISCLEECSTFIDQAQEQVPTHYYHIMIHLYGT